jgi:hypothetical protein
VFAVVGQPKFLHRASPPWSSRADEIGEIAQAVKTFKINSERKAEEKIKRRDRSRARAIASSSK